MGKHIVETPFDDLDGTEGEVTAVYFSANGTEYEIDLNEKNLAKFDKALEIFIEKARVVDTPLLVPRVPKTAPTKPPGTRKSNYPNEYEDNKAMYKEWLMEKYNLTTGKGRQPMDKANEFAEAIRGGWSQKA